MTVYRLKCTKRRFPKPNPDWKPGDNPWLRNLKNDFGILVYEERPNPVEDEYFKKDRMPPGVITVYDNIDSAKKAQKYHNDSYLGNYGTYWYDIIAFEMTEVPIESLSNP